jgi:lysophospholipase L1-like esterase
MDIKKIAPRCEWLLALFLVVPAMASADNNGVRYYVSLGTSLSVGVQPDAGGTNQLTNDGYADQLFDIIEPNYRKIRHVKLGCSGETTTTMMVGGKCTYEEGSQLAQAVQFLHAHKDKVELITIDMGVNDILAAGCIVGTDVDFGCIQLAFNQIGTNLPMILAAITQAADPDTTIVGMNYYNTFLAFWLTGLAGQQLAHDSDFLASLLNYQVLGSAETSSGVYGLFGIPVADVAGAFQSSNFDIAPAPYPAIPMNVLLICQWTYMCAPSPVGPNVHANPIGYGVIAATFAAKLP